MLPRARHRLRDGSDGIHDEKTLACADLTPQLIDCNE